MLSHKRRRAHYGDGHNQAYPREQDLERSQHGRAAPWGVDGRQVVPCHDARQERGEPQVEDGEHGHEGCVEPDESKSARPELPDQQRGDDKLDCGDAAGAHQICNDVPAKSRNHKPQIL